MRFFCAFVFCLVVASFSFGQDSRADLFAGYSYVNIDTNGLTSRQSANGWEASISGNFNKWFAVEGDVSGYFKTYSVNLVSPSTGCVYFGGCSATIKVTDYSFAGGPRVNFKPIFIHALFGGDHLTGGPPISESQDSIAGLVGGGVQWKVSGPWSVRASVDYVFTRHNIFGGPSVTQNDYRAGAGIVYSFRARHVSEKPAKIPKPSAVPANPKPIPAKEEPRQPTPPAPSGTAVTIPALGIMVTLGRSQGAEITDETPSGGAVLAGLHVGDVITAVDGKSVKTPTELAAELSNRSAGDKVRLSYMIHGAWQTDTVIVLGANH
jgi:PDZ domain